MKYCNRFAGTEAKTKDKANDKGPKAVSNKGSEDEESMTVGFFPLPEAVGNEGPEAVRNKGPEAVSNKGPKAVSNKGPKDVSNKGSEDEVSMTASFFPFQ